MRNEELNDKLDKILEGQKRILSNEKKILGEEEKIEEMEREELKEDRKQEQTEEETLNELAKLEKELKKNIESPLKKVTKRDMFKGFIGAFIGVMGHFAFSKAADIAKGLSALNATVLYIVAFFIIVVMLYYTGFRNIEKHIVIKFMPLRALVLYSVSVVTVFIVYLLFGKLALDDPISKIYIYVGASIILATMGAGTADLIGRNE